MKLTLYLCVFVSAALLTGGWCAAGDTGCPLTVKVEQKAVSPSREWRVSYSFLPHRLEMVTFFSGPPEENVSLVYDERSKVRGGWVGTWNLPHDTRGYWIRCSYEGTSVELSRRLPDTVGSCRVTYEEGLHTSSGMPVIRKIECL
jgi:hypothetical protein